MTNSDADPPVEPIDGVMDRATKRDIDADERDRAADYRDLNAARAGSGHDDFVARTESASDRLDAKIDRIASGRDRQLLRRGSEATDPPTDADS